MNHDTAPQVGIDVSKGELVVSVEGFRPFHKPNTPGGVEELIERLPVSAIVHMESSGGYERLARRMLESAGFEVRVHNPHRSLRLAQAKSIKAKTDPIDAAHLAENGRLLPVRKLKSTEREALTDLSRAIDRLKRDIGQYKKMCNAPELDEDARLTFEQAIEALGSVLKQAKATFEKRLGQSSFAGERRLAMTVPGIGPETARICICELPEDFRERASTQIASYAGLAPMDCSSGRFIGQKRLRKGNSRLKAAFYMAAMTAIFHFDWARRLYRGLRQKGKVHQAAIAAVMRRLLVRVLSVLRSGKPWEERPLHA